METPPPPTVSRARCLKNLRYIRQDFLEAAVFDSAHNAICDIDKLDFHNLDYMQGVKEDVEASYREIRESGLHPTTIAIKALQAVECGDEQDIEPGMLWVIKALDDGANYKKIFRHAKKELPQPNGRLHPYQYNNVLRQLYKWGVEHGVVAAPAASPANVPG